MQFHVLLLHHSVYLFYVKTNFSKNRISHQFAKCKTITYSYILIQSETNYEYF